MGTLHSYMWLKRCESTGLTVNSGMTIETEMSLNADGNTAVTACLWQQLADCSMRVMLLRETNLDDKLNVQRTLLTFNLSSKFNARGSGSESECTFTKFVEITQCNSHYAVQGHSRSLILVLGILVCQFSINKYYYYYYYYQSKARIRLPISD